MTRGLRLENTYARDLEGLYVPWTGAQVPAPRILRFNHALAGELGLNGAGLESEAGAAILAGAVAPEGATPLAMAYAGHQFGQFSPQLGDGRALLLGEIITPDGRRCDLHLKGSGRTPFSRGGDGKAALRPVLREYLIGEAMHALGIPTTRALAVLTTGETIYRESLQPGAVLARIGASHLRVGTFQFFAARGEAEKVQRLMDYTIARHHPDLAGTPDRALGLLERVCAAQARLVAGWMLAGFVHGVMNTDNMALSGETLDYGPCAFLDAYDPATVFSSIDRNGRYAYGRQPAIAQWNLARFAETLLDLIDPADSDAGIERASAVIAGFGTHYRAAWLAGMRAKLGIGQGEAQEEAEGGDATHPDQALAERLLAIMTAQQVDYTCLFRALGAAATGDPAPARALFADPAPFDQWCAVWHERLRAGGRPPDLLRSGMEAVNPVYIPRNHRVEAALEAAVAGDMVPFDRLLSLVTHPFTPRPGAEEDALPAPPGTPPHRTFCGT
jgi:serine/tyrosine/threonine adenylyltransferase